MLLRWMKLSGGLFGGSAAVPADLGTGGGARTNTHDVQAKTEEGVENAETRHPNGSLQECLPHRVDTTAK